MTRAEFDEICKLVCPQCRLGEVPTQRSDNREWQHVSVREMKFGGKPGSVQSIGVCWANGLRNSRFAESGK